MNLTEITTSYRCDLLLNAYKNWIKSRDRLLDIGCGNGIIDKIIMHKLGVKVVGCDIENYLMYSLPFKRIKKKRIPFKSQSFDTAMLNDVLHHITEGEQESLLLEAKRVSKKVLIFEAKPTLYAKIADVILNKYHYGTIKIPLTFKGTLDWQKLFKKLGFKYVFQEIRVPFWYPFPHIVFCLY